MSGFLLAYMQVNALVKLRTELELLIITCQKQQIYINVAELQILIMSIEMIS
jgi:hypothetical protein